MLGVQHSVVVKQNQHFYFLKSIALKDTTSCSLSFCQPCTVFVFEQLFLNFSGGGSSLDKMFSIWCGSHPKSKSPWSLKIFMPGCFNKYVSFWVHPPPYRKYPIRIIDKHWNKSVHPFDDIQYQTSDHNMVCIHSISIHCLNYQIELLASKYFNITDNTYHNTW